MTDRDAARLISPAQLLAGLDDLGIDAKTHSHAPLMTVLDSQKLRGNIPGLHAKNLFLKDKKQQLWLVVCEESRAVDLKQLRKRIGAAGLSFGRAELLYETLGVNPGSVTPFSIINDPVQQVRVVLDIALSEAEAVNFHPLTNTQTTTLSGSGLLLFLRVHHHEPVLLDFSNSPS